jgi:hypothetical protein
VVVSSDELVDAAEPVPSTELVDAAEPVASAAGDE